MLSSKVFEPTLVATLRHLAKLLTFSALTLDIIARSATTCLFVSTVLYRRPVCELRYKVMKRIIALYIAHEVIYQTREGVFHRDIQLREES